MIRGEHVTTTLFFFFACIHERRRRNEKKIKTKTKPHKNAMCPQSDKTKKAHASDALE